MWWVCGRAGLAGLSRRPTPSPAVAFLARTPPGSTRSSPGPTSPKQIAHRRRSRPPASLATPVGWRSRGCRTQVELGRAVNQAVMQAPAPQGLDSPSWTAPQAGCAGGRRGGGLRLMGDTRAWAGILYKCRVGPEDTGSGCIRHWEEALQRQVAAFRVPGP